ncbi:MAG: twin-arginine translocase TatA/TatE family subunit [Bacteroidia bacterium]|nr:twin-arginine translocase TatA/TatE family subunit [Bacteroidia bacterium]
MGIGISEIFLILLVALLLFGAKGLPEVARGLGKGLREFKKAADDIKKEISENEVVRDIKDFKDDMKDSTKM